MTIILTLIVLSVLILVHEFGHFFAARILGIRVLNFSLGFGPKIIKWTQGETEFAISSIPFGGYVKLAGDEPEEREYEPHEFLGRPVRHRFMVVFAGPFFNLVLGFLVFLSAYGIFGIPVIRGTAIYSVEPGSPADSAGFQPLDKIISIDGHQVDNWWEIDNLLGSKKTHSISVLRDHDTLSLFLRLSGSTPGVSPLVEPRIGKIIKGSSASKVDLKPGDLIIEVDSIPIVDWSVLVENISKRPGDTVLLAVLRDTDTLRISVPVMSTVDESGKPRGRLGIVVATQVHRIGLIGALKISTEKTIESVVLTFVTIYRLLRRDISVKAIGGPVMIGKIVGQTAGLGMFQLLFLVAIISVNLCVLNLLPIPALDGGHLLIYSIEGIRRRPLHPKVQTLIQQIGFALLIALMVLITIFDIARVFK